MDNIVLVLATRCQYLGVHLSKCVSICLFFVKVLLLLCHFIVAVVHHSLCIHNYRWITTILHSNKYKNNKKNNNKKINLHELLNLFVLILVVVTMSFCCCCCACVIVYTEQQKWHETVSSITKTTKIWIYINCLISKNSYLLHCNVYMTYLSSSQTPNNTM